MVYDKEIEEVIERADMLVLRITVHKSIGKVDLRDYVNNQMVRESKRRLYDDDEEYNRTIGLI